jgi:LacI family transcriptional regulator
VLLDEYAGGYALGAHLLALGHRRLFIHDGSDYRAAQRRLGVQAAFTDQRLDPGQSLIPYPWHGDALAESGQRLLALLRRHPQVTGLIGPDDLDAGEIARCLQRAGYRIPADYSLTGYDDTDALHNDHGENILTTVRVPLRAAGQRAAQCLLDRIADPTLDTPAVTLPVSLIVRTSTAPPRHP